MKKKKLGLFGANNNYFHWYDVFHLFIREHFFVINLIYLNFVHMIFHQFGLVSHIFIFLSFSNIIDRYVVDNR